MSTAVRRATPLSSLLSPEEPRFSLQQRFWDTFDTACRIRQQKMTLKKKEDVMENAFDRDTLHRIIIFTFIWKAVIAFCIRFIPDGIIEDSPQWSWYFGGGLQGTFYPIVLCLAFRNGHCKGNPGKLISWMNSSWADRKSSFYERTFFCGFFAYLLIDIPNVTPLFIAHHIVCMVGIAFALWLPRGHIPMLFGMCMLEMGSFCFVTPKIMPGFFSDDQHLPHSDLRWDRFYWWGMTLSNILCLGTCFYNIFVPFGIQSQLLDKASKGFFTVLTIGLCYMRQEYSYNNMFSAETRYNTMQPHEKIHPNEKWISDTHAAIMVVLYVTIWGGSILFAVLQSYRSEGYSLYPLPDQGKSSKLA